MQQSEARLQAEHIQALAQQQADLEQRHARILEERLSEYYHEVYAAFARDKVCLYAMLCLRERASMIYHTRSWK